MLTNSRVPADFSAFLSSGRFSSLPASFFTHVAPTPLPSPYLVGISENALRQFNLNKTIAQSTEFIEGLTGNKILNGSQPLASVYSGHQFGVWAGQLGDGRALLLGDAIDAQRQKQEIQLKGAGLTPYSRMGDGRAVLRSSIREFLCSEAMAALDIPTSRALCVTGSDQYVFREIPETSAVVTRYAPSFIRFGSFEHWYYNNKPEKLKRLADFVLEEYFPEFSGEAKPYSLLLKHIVKRTAELMAQWQAVGFMHGVMNTDNMSILGLTIDYGPFGFMETYDENHICNHSDTHGRYAYKMQPGIGQWNCYALAQAMLPLIGSVEDTQLALAEYETHFQNKWEQLARKKLGLVTPHADDMGLFNHFLQLLQENHADFSLNFRKLSTLQNTPSSIDNLLRDMFIDRPALDNWIQQYRQRLLLENSEEIDRQTSMKATNPKYILRNYLAQIAIEKAQQKDFSEVAKLLSVLEKPFDEQPENNKYAEPAPDWAKNLEVSCSS
ncbi:MAG: YdiU family protein [Burkholderiales bacterium]|nr:YdiU family protein [Burkholderiales bacterium]